MIFFDSLNEKLEKSLPGGVLELGLQLAVFSVPPKLCSFDQDTDDALVKNC
jgi:hypothetical protein